MKTRMTITIENNLLKRFKEVCDKYGYKMSTKISKLIDEFIKKGKKR